MGSAHRLITINAVAYAPAPSHKTHLEPKAIASIAASAGPSTEKHPFTAHAHGIRAGDFLPNVLIPSAKGMPIKNPSGKIEAARKTAFTAKGHAWAASMRPVRKKPERPVRTESKAIG